MHHYKAIGHVASSDREILFAAVLVGSTELEVAQGLSGNGLLLYMRRFRCFQALERYGFSKRSVYGTSRVGSVIAPKSCQRAIAAHATAGLSNAG
ncbi:hypothetical protein PTKU15_84370 [Paraburkholderia terrae]|nr:hypothetical protein PTKU15_84370 [Paraburkholderia terrae]